MTLIFCDMQSCGFSFGRFSFGRPISGKSQFGKSLSENCRGRSLWLYCALLWLVSTLVVGCVSDERALDVNHDSESFAAQAADGDLNDGDFENPEGDQMEGFQDLEIDNTAPNTVNSDQSAEPFDSIAHNRASGDPMVDQANTSHLAVSNRQDDSTSQNLATAFQTHDSANAAQNVSNSASQPNAAPTRSLFSLSQTTGSEPQARQNGALFAGLFQRKKRSNDTAIELQPSPTANSGNSMSRDKTVESLKSTASSENNTPPLPSQTRSLQIASPASAFSTAFVANREPGASTANAQNTQTVSISANDKIGVMRPTRPINGTNGGLFASLFKPKQALDAEDKQKDDIELASLSGLARLSQSALERQTEKVDIDCLKPELVRLLKKVEDHYQSPVIVTSGYRSKRENRRIGGAAGSLHTQCEAADVQIDGVSKWTLAKYVRTLPERGGVGTYCHTQSVHIDIGPPRDWNWRCRKRKDE